MLFQTSRNCDNRFYYLLIALTILLAGYPYWSSYTGDLITLAMMIPSTYAMRTKRRIFKGACTIAVITAGLSIRGIIQGETGDPLVAWLF